jgi:hypothetical protein
VLRLDGALDGVEHVDGKIQSGVKPPQSKKEGSGISRGDAEARRVGDRVPQLPKTFCGNEGVLECSGLTELWMGIERDDGKIQSGVKPPQSKKLSPSDSLLATHHPPPVGALDELPITNPQQHRSHRGRIPSLF